jgi:hypothetical protein
MTLALSKVTVISGRPPARGGEAVEEEVEEGGIVGREE